MSRIGGGRKRKYSREERGRVNSCEGGRKRESNRKGRRKRESE